MRKSQIAKGILLAVIVAGGLTLAMVAPNAVQVLKLFDNKRRRYYIKDKTLQMVGQGLLKFENKNSKKVLRLTSKGRLELQKYQLGEIKSKKRRWDKKWRIIAYDVWEKNRAKRNLFRTELKNYGFKQLQGSVWIYPYDCREFISLLKAEKKFGSNVRYFVAEEVENDKPLRKLFNL